MEEVKEISENEGSSRDEKEAWGQDGSGGSHGDTRPGGGGGGIEAAAVFVHQQFL